MTFAPWIKSAVGLRQYSVSHGEKGIALKESEGFNLSEGFAVLLNAFGIKTGNASELQPCFDVVELRRRNQNVAKKGT